MIDFVAAVADRGIARELAGLGSATPATESEAIGVNRPYLIRCAWFLGWAESTQRICLPSYTGD